jgi:serine/threonine protein kinase
MSSVGDRVFADRYALDVQISSSLSSPIWRAMDKLLKRWVTLILLPTSDLRSVNLLQECQGAAANDRRDVVSILDVIAAGKITSPDSNSQDTFVGIVTEWLDGESLDRLLIRRGEVLPIDQALKQVGVIANTLMHAHSLNIFHGRLRPHNVIFSPGQEARLAGFGIDSALLGADSNAGVAQDIKGVGQLLFVMVTGMWPLGSVDSLPGAIGPGANEEVLPSQVHVGARSSVDRIYQSTQNGTYKTMRQLVDALSVSEVETSDTLQSRVTRFTANSVTWVPGQDDKSSRVRSTIVAGIAVVVFGWVGWQLLTSSFQDSEIPIATIASPLPSIEATTPAGKPVEIKKIISYDPLGDNSENDDQVGLAIDNDAKTSWVTVVYKNANMGGKAGVGLLLDLGASQELSSVSVTFTSIGQTAEIYVTESSEIDFATAIKFGDTTPTEISTEVAGAKAVSGRYVLIWLTPDLPKSATGKYQGGIVQVDVTS